MNFWIIAVLMLLVASGFILLPLLNKQWGLPLAGGVLVYLISLTVGSYLLFTNNDPDYVMQVAVPASSEERVASVEQMVARLEQRLATEEGNATDWSMLGRSYVFLNRFQDAVNAFARANELSGGNDPGIMIAYAEVLAVTDPESLKTDGAELLNRALRMAPMNAQGLWWGGISAMQLGDEDLARERWERMLELDDIPEAAANVVRQQLAILSGEIGARSDVTNTAGSSDAAVPMRITIDESLAAQLDPTTKLFVFARAVDSGGPPLAVSQHTAADLPLEVTLGQSNVMLPGTRLSDYKNMKLVARLARSGTPVAQSGDLFGEADYEAGQDDRVTVVIDQVVE